MEQMISMLNKNVEVLKGWGRMSNLLNDNDCELVHEMVNRWEVMVNSVIIMNQCLMLTIYDAELAIQNKNDKSKAEKYIEDLCEEMDEYKKMMDDFAKHNEQLVYDLQLLYQYNYEGLTPKEWLKVKRIDNVYPQLQSIYDTVNEEMFN